MWLEGVSALENLARQRVPAKRARQVTRADVVEARSKLTCVMLVILIRPTIQIIAIRNS